MTKKCLQFWVRDGRWSVLEARLASTEIQELLMSRLMVKYEADLKLLRANDCSFRL